MEAETSSQAADRRATGRVPLSVVTALCVAILCSSHLVRAQTESATSEPPAARQESPPPGETSATYRDELAAELAAAQKSLQRAMAEGDDPPPGLQTIVDLLTRIELIYKQQTGAIEQQAQLEQSIKEEQRKLSELRQPGAVDYSSYSFDDLEKARDDFRKAATTAETDVADLQKAADKLDRAKELHDEAERDRLQAKEQAETNEDAARVNALAEALRIAHFNSRIAKAQADLVGLELANTKTNQARNTLKLKYQEEKVAAIAAEVTFEKVDLKDILPRIRAEERALEQKEVTPTYHVGYIESELNEARKKLSDAIKVDPILVENVAALESGLRAHREELSLITKHRDRLTKTRVIWQSRFDLAQGDFDRTKLSGWVEQTQTALEDLDLDIDSQRNRFDALKGDLREVELAIDSAEPAEVRLNRALEEHRRHLQFLVDIHDAELSRMLEHRKLSMRFSNELDAEYGSSSVAKVAGSVWDSIVAA